MPLVYRSHLIDMDENVHQPPNEEDIDFHPLTWDSTYQQRSLTYSNQNQNSASFSAWDHGQEESRPPPGLLEQKQGEEEEEDERKPAAHPEGFFAGSAATDGGSRPTVLGASDSFESSHANLPPPDLKPPPVASSQVETRTFNPHAEYEGEFMPHISMGSPNTPVDILQGDSVPTNDAASSAFPFVLNHDPSASHPDDRAIFLPVETRPSEGGGDAKTELPPTRRRSSRKKRVVKKKETKAKPPKRSSTRRSTRLTRTRPSTQSVEARSRVLPISQVSNPQAFARRQEIPVGVPRANLPRIEPSEAEIGLCSCNRKLNALNTFYDRLNELVQYRDEYGDCNVPQKFQPNQALGVW